MPGLPILAALLILLGTILLIAWRPWGIREGIAAVIGALLMIISGWAGPADVWETSRSTSGIMLFLMSMMVVATVVDKAGFFDWAAGWTIRAARGRVRLLYVFLYLLGAVVTLFLSLDVTAIIFTPIVCASALRLRLNPVPFFFASAFVANTASLTLPVSNLTNMLVYDLLGIDYWAFVHSMALPNMAALAVNLVIFLILFRKDLPARFLHPEFAGSSPQRWFLITAGGALGVVVAALLLAGFAGWPLHLVASAGAVFLTTVGLVGRRLSVVDLCQGVAWQLPLFAVGMYVVVIGVNRAILAPLWEDLLHMSAAQQGVGVVLLAFSTGIGANLVNNIPMSLVAITALGAAPGKNELFSFATVIGTNLGPNLTVFGSLATMLVLASARQRGVEITPRHYFKVGLLTTPPMIVAASLLLLAVSR